MHHLQFSIYYYGIIVCAQKKTLCVKHFTLELNYQNDATDLKKEILTVLEAWRGIEKNYSVSQKSCFGPNSYDRMTQDRVNKQKGKYIYIYKICEIVHTSLRFFKINPFQS